MFIKASWVERPLVRHEKQIGSNNIILSIYVCSTFESPIITFIALLFIAVIDIVNERSLDEMSGISNCSGKMFDFREGAVSENILMFLSN